MGVELTQQDAGGRRTVRVGDEVTVVLAETPTTGYRWHPDVDTTALEPTGDRYDGPTEPRGAGGTRRLTFTARRSGPAHLRVVKRRAWETTGVEEFAVDLDVAAG